MLDADTLTRFFAALALVLALIAALAWAGRRFLVGQVGSGPTGRRRRLAVVEAAPLDGKSRLVIVRRDDVEHLIVLGPHGVSIVENAIGQRSDEPTPVAPQ